MRASFAAGDVPWIQATCRPGEAALTEMSAGLVAAGFPLVPGGHEVVRPGDTALHLMDREGQGPDGVTFRALSVAVPTRDAVCERRLGVDHPFCDGLTLRP